MFFQYNNAFVPLNEIKRHDSFSMVFDHFSLSTMGHFHEYSFRQTPAIPTYIDFFIRFVLTIQNIVLACKAIY